MLLPCQKCKKNWIRLIFGPSRCRNAFKSGQILGVLPLFSTWRPLWTPVRAYEPIYTSRHMKYMSWDMWEHSSVHSGSILGRAEGPTAPKNHDFSEFHQFPQRCDPKGGPFTNNYSHTHMKYMSCDMLEHSSVHFGSILDRLDSLRRVRYTHYRIQEILYKKWLVENLSFIVVTVTSYFLWRHHHYIKIN